MEWIMKFCPMCGTTQSEPGSTVCKLCDYEEKRFEELSREDIDELMAPYDYEMIGDGARIKSVKNGRDLALRGAVAIPNFVTEIAPYAFSCCKFLARIELPRGLRSIGEGAFAQCRDLFDVFIPVGVDYIGKGAFAGCHDLSVICAGAPTKPDGWDSEWLSDCSARVEWSSTDEV